MLQVPPTETWPMVSVPRLPISLNEMHFSELEALELHAMYGLTGSSLKQLFSLYAEKKDDIIYYHIKSY